MSISNQNSTSNDIHTRHSTLIEAMGAAIFGAMAAGSFPSMSDAVTAMGGSATTGLGFTTYMPDPTRAAYLDGMHARYLELAETSL